MRKLFSSIIAASLLTSNLAAAQCARPVEKAAFDIAGLKSQLMVAAITCQAQPKYNAFVTRYRVDLVTSSNTMSTYFSRAYGRRGQAAYDDYITSLANAQSDAGIQSGNQFCNRTLSLFDEVMALRSNAELPTYAASKGLVQPIALLTCGSPTTTVATSSAVRR